MGAATSSTRMSKRASSKSPKGHPPILIYVTCVLLASVFWVVLWSSRMKGFAATLYILFLPLTGTPYEFSRPQSMVIAPVSTVSTGSE
jgi:hypothetical protein